MTEFSNYTNNLSKADFSHAERAIGFLWFYGKKKLYYERTTSDLASDMSKAGFAHENVSRLRRRLLKSNFVVRGTAPDSFKINHRHLSEIENIYKKYDKTFAPKINENIIPFAWVKGTRSYLIELVKQINGSYEFGFYDCCAVMIRRLMESLIIEVYYQNSREHDITDNNGNFLLLENLIKFITNDRKIILQRKSSLIMKEIKDIGDTAAHNRVYITRDTDIKEKIPRVRLLIKELLTLSGIKP